MKWLTNGGPRCQKEDTLHKKKKAGKHIAKKVL